MYVIFTGFGNSCTFLPLVSYGEKRGNFEPYKDRELPSRSDSIGKYLSPNSPKIVQKDLLSTDKLR